MEDIYDVATWVSSFLAPGIKIPLLFNNCTHTNTDKQSMATTEHGSSNINQSQLITSRTANNNKTMQRFPELYTSDFKHVLYNLLVDNHNDPQNATLLRPYTYVDPQTGQTRYGFQFNPSAHPEKKIPELYALHIRKARLDIENPDSVFTQDLYRFYLRACIELMSKYFEKKDNYIYLYDEVPLFVPNENLEEAEARLRTMKSRYRRKKKKK